MKIKEYKDKIIAVVVFLLANIICPIIVSKIQNIDFINAFVTMWKKIFEVLITILKFPIPVWVIILTIFIIYICLRIYLVIIDRTAEDESWYKNYSSDTYNGIMYEWTYSKYGNTIKMEKITPICKKCNGNVTVKHNGYYSSLYCPNCNQTYNNPNSEEYDSAKTYFNNTLKKLIDKHNESLK